MSCDRMQELISARIDREIIFEDQELESHLENCADCRNELEGTRRLHNLLEQAFATERDASEVLVDKVKATLQAHGRSVNRCTVLLVDDEQQILLSQRGLLSDEFNVLIARTAQEAQALFNQQQIDIILTDQRLGGASGSAGREITGVELLEWVLAHHPRTQRLLWTGYPDFEKVVEAVNRAQVFRYLVKPDTNNAVLHALRAAARMLYLERDHERVLRELSELNVQLEERVRQRTRELEEAYRELEQRTRTLEKFALTDALTLLPNRAALDHFVERELYHCSRFPAPLAVAIIDVDFFKDINTKFLHPGGDLVLCQLARCMTGMLRRIDVLGRWAGDEFMLIAPQTQRAGALVLAERLRALVQNHTFSYNGQRIPVTVTIGLAVVEAGRPAHYQQIKEVAAAALKRAKIKGRDCVEVEAVAASDSLSDQGSAASA